MVTHVLILLLILFALLTLGFFIFLHWGTRWGSTSEERALEMRGDVYLEGRPEARVSMTRAILIAASPQTVWPWLAQLGRGAGWYSIDWLDNRGRESARHIISWIPEPKLGDASPVGYLRHIEYNKALVWWLKGTKFLGALTRLVVDMRLAPESKESGPRGPGFDFTPEGWSLLLDFQWNDGMVEYWNIGYKKRSAAGGLISDLRGVSKKDFILLNPLFHPSRGGSATFQSSKGGSSIFHHSTAFIIGIARLL